MTPYFPVSLNLQGRPCVVIGDDREAQEKAAALQESGAQVRRIRDAGSFADDDVRDVFFVIATPQDAALCSRLRRLADERRFLLCCIDQPAFGFVAMAAIVKSGPVRLAISTAGLAPRVGKILKEALQRALDARFARFIDCQATQKARNRSRFPDSSAERRRAMIELARGFGLDIRVRYPRWFEESEARRVPVRK